MGDTTAITMTVKSCSDVVKKAARERFGNYAAESLTSTTTDTDDGLTLIATVSVGTSDELAAALRNAMADVVEPSCPKCWGDGCKACYSTGVISRRVGEFAFRVHEDPRYTWNGTLNVFVPDYGSYRAACDADGDPIVDPDALATLVKDAEDLEELKKQVLALTGDKILWEFDTYVPDDEDDDLDADLDDEDE